MKVFSGDSRSCSPYPAKFFSLAHSALRDIKFSKVNFGSVNVNSLVNKVNFVTHWIEQESLDVVSVSETWLISSVPSSFVAVAGFQVVRGDVEGEIRKHGTCLYISDRLAFVPVDLDIDRIANLACIYLSDVDTFVLSVYRPPSYTDLQNARLISFLFDFCIGKEIVVLGDFNLPFLDWSLENVLQQYVSPRDLSFYDCFCSVGLCQWVREGTFMPSGNVLDLVLTSETDRVGELYLLPPFPRCHHCPVVFEYFMQLESPEEENAELRRMWFKGNYERVSLRLEEVDWGSQFRDLLVGECFVLLIDCINSLIRSFVPLSPVNRKPQWLKSPPQVLVHERTLAWNTYKTVRVEFGRRHERSLEAYERFSVLNYRYRHFVVSA